MKLLFFFFVCFVIFPHFFSFVQLEVVINSGFVTFSKNVENGGIVLVLNWDKWVPEVLVEGVLGRFISKCIVMFTIFFCHRKRILVFALRFLGTLI